jgi:DNA-binding response OmpR family regulator
VTAKRVLLIEDSVAERAIVCDRLRRDGYDVIEAGDGREGLRRLYESHPDIVLLDVVMPELDGWKTLDQIRQVTNVPVIMLTARNTDIERVRGLRTGADDYLGKPYSPAELVARIEAVLRRGGGEQGKPREVWDDGTVRIDFGSTEVTVHDEAVSLTPLEFRLLAVLTEYAGQVLSSDQLLELVWGDPIAASTGQVKSYVGYLRRKIERDPAAPELVETVRGFGYRYRRRR